MNMKILYTAFDVVPSPKGASTHISYFVQGLVQAGYQVTLITAGDAVLPEQDNYLGATILRVPIGEQPNFLVRAMAFGDYICEHVAHSDPYQLIHVRSFWDGYTLAQAKAAHGYKLLYEVNGLPSVEMKYHYPALHYTPTLHKFAQRELFTFQQADALVTPSPVTHDYLTSLNISSEKITVIPNGIDPTHFKPQPQPPTQTPTLLYIGTLADWQGLDTLIAALPYILAQQTVQLRIIGRGRKRQRKLLLKQIHKLNLTEAVTLEEAIPFAEIPQAVAQAAVCVAPLGFNDRNVTQGCCPLKILEYMACGRPVVAANLPVVRHIMRPHQDGLVFTPDDPRDLAEKVLMLLQDEALAMQLTLNATTQAHRHFTWAQAQAKLLAVYQQLLN